MIEIEERRQAPVGEPAVFQGLAPFDGNESDRTGETPHGFLRRVTRTWHDGVESAFERFDLQTFEGLSGFLLRQAVALLPIEAALEAGDVTALLPDWPQRRRAAFLRADLAALGLGVPPLAGLPVFAGPLPMLGALYVLEGSKLGGRVLHRRVMASDDTRVRAAASFLGHRHERGWTSFLAALDASPSDPTSFDALAAGARTAFAQFHAAATLDGVSGLADALVPGSDSWRPHG